MLESTLKEQLKGIFAGLNANYTFDISISPAYESRQELLDLLGDVASCSDKISMQVSDGEGLEFILLKDGAKTGIKFRGVPNGHEFTSLLLAILNSDGKGKNFPDESICNRVKALNGPIHLTTYVSLTCTNCPDVVQALNAMTTLNPQIHHEMVDGVFFRQFPQKYFDFIVKFIYFMHDKLSNPMDNRHNSSPTLTKMVFKRDE